MPTAAIFDRHGMIVFGPEIPTDQREPIGRLGGRIIEDATLEEEPDAHDWPEGAEAPRPVLGISRTGLMRYKVFRSERRITGDFRPARMQYTVLHRPGSWRDFVENLEVMDRIASHTDASDTDEVWAEVDRLLTGQAG